MNRKKILFLLIELLIAILLFIVFFKLGEGVYLLIAFFIVGFSISELLRREVNFDTNDFLAIIIGLVIVFFESFAPINNPPIKAQLNRLYFPKNKIDLNQEYFSQFNQNSEPLKLVFAFDNSSAGLAELLPESLKNEYVRYSGEVRQFCNLIIPKNSKAHVTLNKISSIKYGEFLKVRLCYDLIQRKDDTAEFIVIKIGDPSDKKSFIEENEFSEISEKSIQNEIIKILNTDNYEVHTGFDLFFKTLHNLILLDNKNSTFSFYLYSDFYHDYEGLSETETDRTFLLNDRKDILLNKVQNYFIDDHKQDNQGVYILDSIPNNKFENYIYIKELNIGTSVPLRIYEADDILWFYSKDFTKKIHTNFNLNFDQRCNSIRLVSNIQGIKLANHILYHNESVSFNPRSNINLEYIGSAVPYENPTFDISHNSSHYFITFIFVKEWDDEWKFILPFVSITLGFLIGLIQIKRI